MNTSLVGMFSMAVYVALGLVLLIALALVLLGAIGPDQTLTAGWRRGG